MPRLGEILLAENVLTVRELDSALENHVLHGVKLGTCLVEMGYVSDDDLARCLGIQTGYSFLTKEQLFVAGNRHLSLLSPNVIKKYRIIPVGIEGAALCVALDHDLTSKKQAELERFLNRTIEPVAVSGYAVDYFLEQIFGVPRPGRFLPKYSKHAASVSTPAGVDTVKEDTGPVIINGVEWKNLGEVTQTEESTQMYDEVYNGGLMREEYPRTISETAERLSRATSRDDVAKAVLDFLSSSAQTVALLMIKDEGVRGWKASTNKKEISKFEDFSATLAGLSDLKQAVYMKKPYFGHTMTPETQMLLHTLHYTGGAAAYFPIFVQQRVVAVLFCDASESLNAMQVVELCRKASFALEILILRSKLLRS